MSCAANRVAPWYLCWMTCTVVVCISLWSILLLSCMKMWRLPLGDLRSSAFLSWAAHEQRAGFHPCTYLFEPGFALMELHLVLALLSGLCLNYSVLRQMTSDYNAHDCKRCLMCGPLPWTLEPIGNSHALSGLNFACFCRPNLSFASVLPEHLCSADVVN